MKELIHFDTRFVARPVTERDRPLLELWISQDPDHCGRVDAEFFLADTPVSACTAVEDSFETVIFYLRLTIANGSLQFDIQFGLDGNRQREIVTMRALEAGCRWFKTAAFGVGLREIRFESADPSLQRFTERRLGFERDGNTLTYAIGAKEEYEAHQKALQG